MVFTHWDERSRHSTRRSREKEHELGLAAEGIARMFKRLYYSHSQGRPANTVFEGTAESGKAKRKGNPLSGRWIRLALFGMTPCTE